MEIILVVLVGTLCIVCFLIGAKVGQQVANGEPVEVKLPDPIEKIREHREKKQAEEEQKRMDVIYQNLETYNGTEIGQRDVPRG